MSWTSFREGWATRRPAPGAHLDEPFLFQEHESLAYRRPAGVEPPGQFHAAQRLAWGEAALDDANAHPLDHGAHQWLAPVEKAQSATQPEAERFGCYATADRDSAWLVSAGS